MCESECMATLHEICYFCCSDLSSKYKDRVIIRNKNDEYSCLYSIVVDVLRNEKLEMEPVKIHQKINKVFCKSCWRTLNRYSNTLKTIESLKNRIKLLFLNEVSIDYDIHFYQPKTNKHCVNHLGQLLNKQE